MLSFQYICCFCVLLSVCNATSSMSDLPQIISDCQAKTGVSMGSLASSLKDMNSPEAESATCFVACIKMELGLWHENNTLNMSRVEEILTPLKNKNPTQYAALMDSIGICAAEQVSVSNQCMASKNIIQCMGKQMQANGGNTNLLSLLMNN